MTEKGEKIKCDSSIRVESKKSYRAYETSYERASLIRITTRTNMPARSAICEPGIPSENTSAFP